MNAKNNIEKESAGISAYIKRVLDHDFNSMTKILSLTNSEIAESIMSLASEYRNSLIRTEDYVSSLAEEKNKAAQAQKIYGRCVRSAE